MLINNLAIDQASEVLSALAARLRESRSGEARRLLGEVCWMLGRVCMLRCETDFPEYFKLSSECLPDGSPVKSTYLHVGNCNIFRMADNLPGARERMENAIYKMSPYFVKVAKGGGSGIEHLFSAEASYFSCDLNMARQNALKAIYAAGEAGQHDILCNARVILGRAALMRGDYNEFAAMIESVRDYINERELVSLYDLRDCALGRLHLAVGDFDRIAGWIIAGEPDGAERAPVFYGCDQIIHAGCLLGMKKYHELLALLDHLENLYKLQGRWVDENKSYILRAIGYLRLGEVSRALSSLWQAYDMSFQNNIVTPFIEEGYNMRSLIDAAKASGEFNFDGRWLDEIYRKSSTYGRRMSIVAKEHKKRNRSEPDIALKLSKREMAVLDNMSQGLTRDEIAVINSISVNTVKSAIKSVYNKLGAVNRADAVRIATVRGLLK
jgi:LuxR family maltose regulon positive regulatory protein